jgi:hypothetical protein
MSVELKAEEEFLLSTSSPGLGASSSRISADSLERVSFRAV